MVTGKLDVREAAAQLPDEVEEPEPLDEADAESDEEEADGGDLDEVRRGGRGMTTDTSEKGLESLIVARMTGATCDPDAAMPARTTTASGLRRWLDLRSIPTTTTASTASTSPSSRPSCARRSQRRPSPRPWTRTGPTRRKFLARLQGEITKRGVIDVLRNGIKHGPH